jgi:hypothetical protein
MSSPAPERWKLSMLIVDEHSARHAPYYEAWQARGAEIDVEPDLGMALAHRLRLRYTLVLLPLASRMAGPDPMAAASLVSWISSLYPNYIDRVVLYGAPDTVAQAQVGLGELPGFTLVVLEPSPDEAAVERGTEEVEEILRRRRTAHAKPARND